MTFAFSALSLAGQQLPTQHLNVVCKQPTQTVSAHTQTGGPSMVRAASAMLFKHVAYTRQMGSLRSCCSRSLPFGRRRPRCAPAAAVHWAFWQLATSWHLTRQQQFALHAAAVALHSTDSGATAAAGSAAPPSTQPSELEGRLLDMHIGPGLRLMEQRFDIHGHVFTMLAPHDVDQVLDMYIEAGRQRGRSATNMRCMCMMLVADNAHGSARGSSLRLCT